MHFTLQRPLANFEEGFDDDRDSLDPADRVVLVIENDASFAKILLDMAREKGFKGLVALDGEAGLRVAHAYKPDAIKTHAYLAAAREAGAQEVLTKPFDMNDLLAAVRRQLPN